jgi:hypothetical protein
MRLVGICFFILTTVSPAQDFQGASHMTPFDEDTIAYSKTAANGPVERLAKAIVDGKVKLEFDEKFGYLPSVLKGLGISPESQMLVFSKTSFQRERIDPSHPRALFFNDDVYIGYIPGSPLLEISQAEPKLGAVFYTLDQKKVERPKFERNDQCLECHASGKSMGVPGHLLRSFDVEASGVVDLKSGASEVNHRTPIAERWGGWYVTGQHGGQHHRGNIFGAKALAQAEKEPNFRGNITNLSSYFDVSKYPRNQSDIVALMVLEHQTHMHNFLTRLRYEAALSLYQYGKIDYLKSKVDAFVHYLLFTEEAPITNAISGSPAFVKEFEARGPFDSKGRSLRQFDLRTRLFKYPCSYLIYSDAFEELQPQVKSMVYARLLEILSTDGPSKVRSLSPQDREAITEILKETKPEIFAAVANR